MKREIFNTYPGCMALVFLMSGNQVYALCDNYCHKNIQSIIDHDRELYSIPGVQVSIIFPGENIPDDFVSGSIKDNINIPVQQNNYFQIGSETKSFVATILLQLEAEQRLSLDDKIIKWLPFIPATWNKVTIRQLLNHTSGIYNYDDVLIEMASKGKLNLNKQWSAPELINLIIEKNVYFPPGKGWHYSGTNYVLAGMIIESVTHMAFRDVINSRLLQPLILQNTYYISWNYDYKTLLRMSHGYSRTKLFHNMDVLSINPSWSNTASAVISTAHDMVIWIKTFLTGNILPIAQLHEMMSLVDRENGQPIPVTSNKSGYGLAIMHDFTTYGEETWSHSGATLGFSSYMIWLKSSNIFIAIHGNDLSAALPEKRDLFYLTQDVIAFLQNNSN